MVSQFSLTRMVWLWNTCIPFAVSFLAYLILGPVFLFFVLYRQAVIIFAKVARPDLIAFETGKDCIYATEKLEYGRYNINNNFIIDKEVTPQRIGEMFQDHILNLKNKDGQKLYQKLTQHRTNLMGYAFWAPDKEFNISNHIRKYDYENVLQLPTPSDMSKLETVLPKLLKLPWEQKRSHWEMLFVTNFSHKLGQSSCKTLIIFRFDNGLCDGHSVGELYRKLFQSPFKQPGIASSRVDLTPWHKLKILLTLPYALLQPMCNFSRENSLDSSNYTDVCICDLSENFPDGRIKSIKNEIGVGHAAVMLGTITAAFAKVLKKFSKKAPKTLATTLAVPLSDHPGEICNYGTFCELDIPCNEKKSPIEHILHIDTLLKEASKSLSNFTTDYRVRLISLLPLCLVKQFTQVCGTVVGSIDVSNFPCTSTREFIDGGEILDCCVTVNPNCGIGVMISSCGVNNQHTMCFHFVENTFNKKLPPGILSTTFMQELDVIESEIRSRKQSSGKENNKKCD